MCLSWWRKRWWLTDAGDGSCRATRKHCTACVAPQVLRPCLDAKPGALFFSCLFWVLWGLLASFVLLA